MNTFNETVSLQFFESKQASKGQGLQDVRSRLLEKEQTKGTVAENEDGHKRREGGYGDMMAAGLTKT